MEYIWLALILIMLVMIGLSAFFGFKKGWFRAAVALGANLVAMLLAFGVTKILTLALGNTLAGVVANILSGLITDSSALEVLKLDSAMALYKLISQLVLAIVAFPLLYVIFYFLCKIPKKIILDKFSEKVSEKYPADWQTGKILAPILGGVSGLLAFFFFFSTFAGTGVALDRTAKAHPSYPETVAISDTVDALAGNPIFVVDSAVTTPIYAGLCGASMKELTNFADIAFYALDFNLAQDSETQVACLEGVRTNFNESNVLAPLVADFVTTAASEWRNGKSFMGISFTIPSGMTGSLYTAFLNTLADMHTDNIRENVNSIIDLFELVLQNEFLSAMIPTTGNTAAGGSTGGTSSAAAGLDATALMATFSDPDELTDFYMVFLTNDDLSGLLPALTSAGMTEAMAGMGVKMPSDLQLDADLSGMTEEEIRAEATMTANVVGNLTDYMNSHEGFYFDRASDDEIVEFLNLMTDLDNSVVAQSVMPTIVAGIAEGISRSHEDLAADLSKANSIEDLTKIMKNYKPE